MTSSAADGPVDLRSDTVTRPTDGMRRAMAAAEVGDDVYGEDPSVRRLEEEVAELLGHEAALFVPTGSMGNQICLRLLAEPGEEILTDTDAHIVSYELGAAAALSGLSTRTVPLRRGRPDLDGLAAHLRPAGFGTVRTAAVAVEQTHNRAGGAVLDLEALRALRAAAQHAGARVHMDGARLWNACAATGTEPARYAACADTVSVCLSKGLGAPVGSLVVCGAEPAARARVLRKRMGGGMRQVGILAAAGSYALRHHRSRLADDHRRARRLAAELGCAVPDTNVVVLLADEPRRIASLAAEQGVLLGVAGADRIRMVTHLDVDDRGIERAIEVVCGLLAAGPAARGPHSNQEE